VRGRDRWSSPIRTSSHRARTASRWSRGISPTRSQLQRAWSRSFFGKP
jgi:hypothetical protein